MRKTRQKSKFTLVELIVAMAVFSILLLLMLQFFSGAQRIWNGMEKRNDSEPLLHSRSAVQDLHGSE